jgi:hypothetical protein
MLRRMKSNNVAPQLSEKRIAKLTENWDQNGISGTFATLLTGGFSLPGKMANFSPRWGCDRVDFLLRTGRKDP